MARFMDEDFLLGSRSGRRLFHEHAARQPIVDFHCHLPPQEIAENRSFHSLAEAWLGDDHYKWRAMRACGVAEKLITGNVPDAEKLAAWAAVVPSTIGNPLYHWTHLELKRYFGVSGVLLSPSTVAAIDARCTRLLGQEDFRVRALLVRMNVEVVCTTDDPVDSLEHHVRLRNDPAFTVKVVPTFRPDAAMAVEDPASFTLWVEKLADAAGGPIRGWADFVGAIRKRHAFFHGVGCRASDHGIEEAYAEECSPEEADRHFRKVNGGAQLDDAETRAFKSAVLGELARMDADRGWVMQLHLGALRNVNSRHLKMLGPNTGFDATGDWSLGRSLARFLDALDKEERLPKTILYCLNPADNQVLATLAGGYPQEGVRNKVQFGPAWWFNDQKHGMEAQLKGLADVGLLPRFVGMVTDSRSFLSYPRHEYFRRILCQMLGSAMDHGEAPMDFALMGGIVEDICHRNAKELFGF